MFDSKTKELVTTNRFYATDIGIGNFAAGPRLDKGLDGILENVIYNELNFRYMDVAIASVDGSATVFVSDPLDSPRYWLVSANIGDSQTRENVLEQPMAVRDFRPNTAITLDGFPLEDIDGIRIIMLRDWLREEW